MASRKTRSTSIEPRVSIGAEVRRLTKVVAACDVPALDESHDARGVALAAALAKLGYAVDLDAGLRAVRFVERYCRHTTGQWWGVRFRLLPWQYVGTFCLFGVIDETGKRLFRRFWLEVAKKNGKSSWAAALLLFCLFGWGVYGAQIYSAAASREQATLIYRFMASMVRQSPALRKKARIYDSIKRIYLPTQESFYQALSSDADYNDGIIPLVAAIDEVHRHKSRDLYDVLINGMGTMDNPLLLEMTTAGANRTGLAWDEHEYARQVIEGTLADRRLLPMVYSVPEEADWQDPKVWGLANPSMGEFLREDDVAEAVAAAKTSPGREHSVRRLRLNQWVAAETKWLDLSAWDACGGIVHESDLEGRDFYGGLDISHSKDFTAWCLFSPWEDAEPGRLGGDALWRLWLPEEGLDIRPQLRPTIEAWVRAGFIRVTPGGVVDLREVLAQIQRDCERFNCREIGYDRFHAHGIISELNEQGLELADVGQSYRFLNEPCGVLERMLEQRRLNTGGNPVLRWMAGNAVAERNRDDLVRPSRLRSADKIDGLMALLSAINRVLANTGESGLSIYVLGEEAV
jgi:phage terminase large subunit-like protein